MNSNLEKNALWIFIAFALVWCFALTYLYGDDETDNRRANVRIAELENTVEKLQYRIENQQDTIIINIENNIPQQKVNIINKIPN